MHNNLLSKVLSIQPRAIKKCPSNFVTISLSHDRLVYESISIRSVEYCYRIRFVLIIVLTYNKCNHFTSYNLEMSPRINPLCSLVMVYEYGIAMLICIHV